MQKAQPARSQYGMKLRAIAGCFRVEARNDGDDYDNDDDAGWNGMIAVASCCWGLLLERCDPLQLLIFLRLLGVMRRDWSFL